MKCVCRLSDFLREVGAVVAEVRNAQPVKDQANAA